MKVETVSAAAVAALIGFLTALLALFQQESVTGIADIAENAWWVMGLGAALSFLKDYQSISSRRLATRMKAMMALAKKRSNK